MFSFKKKAQVRILDTPLKMHIYPDVLVVPFKDDLGNDKVMIIPGAFEHTPDSEAFRIASDTKDSLKVV